MKFNKSHKHKKPGKWNNHMWSFFVKREPGNIAGQCVTWDNGHNQPHKCLLHWWMLKNLPF